MAMQMPEWLKPGAGGAIAGAIALAVIAFSADWVMTAGAAEELAAQREVAAVVAALKPICVAQFRAETEEERTTTLAALEEQGSWEQGDYVEEQGWATMPGSTEANDEVAEACADELLKLAEI